MAKWRFPFKIINFDINRYHAVVRSSVRKVWPPCGHVTTALRYAKASEWGSVILADGKSWRCDVKKWLDVYSTHLIIMKKYTHIVCYIYMLYVTFICYRYRSSPGRAREGERGVWWCMAMSLVCSCPRSAGERPKSQSGSTCVCVCIRETPFVIEHAK